MPLPSPRVYMICEPASLANQVLCFKGVLKWPDFSNRSKQFCSKEKDARTLQVALFVPAHTVNFVGQSVKVRFVKQMLFNVKDNVECGLF